VVYLLFFYFISALSAFSAVNFLIFFFSVLSVFSVVNLFVFSLNDNLKPQPGGSAFYPGDAQLAGAPLDLFSDRVGDAWAEGDFDGRQQQTGMGQRLAPVSGLSDRVSEQLGSQTIQVGDAYIAFDEIEVMAFQVRQLGEAKRMGVSQQSRRTRIVAQT